MAAKTPDLRKLKDQATKALEKKSYAKAAELYLEIASVEEDPDWRQRAGEALRKAGKNEEAVTQLTSAASSYAEGGFLLKAIAVCKVVLQLDPRHTETQTILARLYAQRDGVSRPPAPLDIPSLPRSAPPRVTTARAMPPPPPGAASRAMPPPPPPLAASRAMPPPPPLPPRAPLGMLSMDDLSVDVSSMEGPPPVYSIPLPFDLPRSVPVADFSELTASLPPGAPMDALPLASVLGGRRSEPAPGTSDYGVELDGSAYEIELDIAPAPLVDPSRMLNTEVAPTPELPSLPRSRPHRTVPPPLPPARSSPPAPPPPASPPADELDFSSVMEDAPAPAPPPAQPAAAPDPADELDFSMVMDDAKPLPVGRPITAAPQSAPVPVPNLPRIPLFSTLDPHELRALIEGVAVRDFEAGDTILKQGEQGLSLFVIVRGQVEVLLEGPPQKEIATLGEGAFFGELALLTDFPRSATVIAQVDTQCLEISRALAAQVIADSPDVLKTMLRFFRDRMLDRFLNSSPLFTRFNAEDARGLMARFKFLEIEPKARVVQEGERAAGLYVLMCGEAQVVQGSVPIAKLAPGDVFGEMSLLARKPAMASIDTLSKCWALQLHASEFQEIMLTYPQFLEFVSSLADSRTTENIL